MCIGVDATVLVVAAAVEQAIAPGPAADAAEWPPGDTADEIGMVELYAGDSALDVVAVSHHRKAGIGNVFQMPVGVVAVFDRARIVSSRHGGFDALFGGASPIIISSTAKPS